MKQTSIFIILGVILAIAIVIITYDSPTHHYIVPKPDRAEIGNGHFSLNEKTIVLIAPKAVNETFIQSQFLSKFRKVTGLPLPIKEEKLPEFSSNTIQFILDDKRVDLEKEGYEVLINNLGIRITAAEPPGLFYGTQTLYQLFPVEIDSPVPNRMKSWEAPYIRIVDTPRFSWRGMHLDTCRHFFTVSFIKKYLDIMARYKLNTFHWHLTEDQGWRIEIKKYPRLTEIGAWRKETLLGHYRDQPHKFDRKPHGGFYSQKEIREIIQYAKERYITTVPEIEMPGHALAALAAYPEFSCTGGPFEVATIWGIFDDVYCAGNDQVFQFLEDVLSEVIDLFPGTYIHIGGDECPKTRWEKCSRCLQRIQDEGLKDTHQLQSYFIKRIEKFLVSKGRRLIGWDEILEGGLAPQATVMSWRGMAGGIEAANAGHDVVMSPTSHCYFDYNQAKKGEPLGIGGHLPLKKVYRFEPVPKDIDPGKKDHILGGQANLWTEYIKTPEHAEYMLLPRMCALSEIVWTDPSERRYKNFTRRMKDHYKRLTLMDVNFRCPD